MKFDHSSRLLFGALAASLLLHLLVVFGWGWVPRTSPALPHQAMQVVVVASAPSLASAGSARPPARSEPNSAPVPVPTAHRTKPVEQSVMTAEKTSETTVKAPPESAALPMETSVSKVPAESSSAMPGSALAEPVLPAGGVSADGMRQYRIELAGAARRFRSYPAIARSRGWEGVAEVTVVVNAGLPAPSLQLARTSGHTVLDEQALDMLSRAVASTPLPESLRGRSFSVPMPIRFSLQE